MRMSASWVRVARPAEYKVVARDFAPAVWFPSRFSPRRTDGRPAGPDIIVRRQPTREIEPRRQSKIHTRGRAPMCAFDEGARLVDVGSERRPLSPRAREGRKIRREMGVISAHRPRTPIVRRWPDPCKGWPSATASGGFGLDKGLASDILRRQGFDGQEQASRWTPTRLPRPVTTQIFLLTKKTPYKAG